MTTPRIGLVSPKWATWTESPAPGLGLLAIAAHVGDSGRENAASLPMFRLVQGRLWLAAQLGVPSLDQEAPKPRWRLPQFLLQARLRLVYHTRLPADCGKTQRCI